METNSSDKMKICSNCFEAVPQEANVCPYCGNRLGEHLSSNTQMLQRLRMILAVFYGLFSISIVGIALTLLLG
jgi:predicted amidophosphoribosyltransferase